MQSDNRPVYLKLRDIVAAAILNGTYPEGSMLPSVRNFAKQQAANPLTVAKAYQLFQDDGLIDVQRGVGLVVRLGAVDKLRQMERAYFLTDIWPEMQQHMQRAGLKLSDLTQLEKP